MIYLVITAESEPFHWDFTIANFAPDEVLVHGDPTAIASRLDLRSGAHNANIRQVTGSSDLPSDHSLVVLAPQNGENVQGLEPLDTFEHPENAVYWFGADHQAIKPEVFSAREPDHLVYIPTPSGELHAATAWTLVWWDRHTKQQRSQHGQD
jgi:hypothetical protein